jgi:hypothetical protein
MKKLTGALLGLSLVVGCALIATAQDESAGATTPPPKVFVIFREYVKPGKDAAHDKSESAFVAIMRKAKWPTHYSALQAMSGKPRVLFLTGYDSFEAWEKDNAAMDKNPALSAELAKSAATDGELLNSVDQMVFTYDEDQSLRAPVDIAKMRYFEITSFQVRPGHRQEWRELVKLAMSGYANIPDAHWAMYEEAYGPGEGTDFALLSPIRSLAEVDQEFAESKQFRDALGEDGMKKLAELEAASVESEQTNLFRFNPKMSYPPDSWVKEDPGFWKPTGEMMHMNMPMHMGKKPMAKPEAK